MRRFCFARCCGPKFGSAICALLVFFVSTAIVSFAQTLTPLYSFCSKAGCADGATPINFNGLVQGIDGNFYGETIAGGVSDCTTNTVAGCGTTFRITPAGKLTTLHSFVDTDGNSPGGGLIQATDEQFYGTTFFGGTNGDGTVFGMTAKGAVTSLHSFLGTDGSALYSTLVQGTDGDFFGTTYSGGEPTAGCSGCGTIFEITPGGALNTLHGFCSSATCADGLLPWGGLIQATDGNFYGTTEAGGANSGGTVFKITVGGALTTLYNFCSNASCADGKNPLATLVQAQNGDFYGTTEVGGANNDGTVFKITPSGKLTTLYSFSGADGANPYSGLIQATDGNFYGTTVSGGANNDGAVFKLTPAGKLTTYSFDVTNGASPYGGLIQATNGDFYGTASAGGIAGDGTVFRLSLGLNHFVKTQTTSGKEGAPVIILGTALKGATKVSFNGTAAVFSVVGSSEITTTVPEGATSGYVTVVLPSGTLTSNTKFRVKP